VNISIGYIIRQGWATAGGPRTIFKCSIIDNEISDVATYSDKQLDNYDNLLI